MFEHRTRMAETSSLVQGPFTPNPGRVSTCVYRVKLPAWARPCATRLIGFMFCQVVSQLSFKESPASAAFQVSLAPESVSLIQISFVINQLQRTSMGSGKTLF